MAGEALLPKLKHKNIYVMSTPTQILLPFIQSLIQFVLKDNTAIVTKPRISKPKFGMIVDSPRQQLPYSFAITLHNSRNCHGSHLTGSFFGIEIGWDADVGARQGLMVKTQQEAVNKVVYVFVCVYISMFGQIAK